LSHNAANKATNSDDKNTHGWGDVSVKQETISYDITKITTPEMFI